MTDKDLTYSKIVDSWTKVCYYHDDFKSWACKAYSITKDELQKLQDDEYKYDVYINMNLKATNVTMDEAWKVVGNSTFGSGYLITYTGTMDCIPHTVPY